MLACANVEKIIASYVPLFDLFDFGVGQIDTHFRYSGGDKWIGGCGDDSMDYMGAKRVFQKFPNMIVDVLRLHVDAKWTKLEDVFVELGLMRRCRNVKKLFLVCDGELDCEALNMCVNLRSLTIRSIHELSINLVIDSCVMLRKIKLCGEENGVIWRCNAEVDFGRCVGIKDLRICVKEDMLRFGCDFGSLRKVHLNGKFMKEGIFLPNCEEVVMSEWRGTIYIVGNVERVRKVAFLNCFDVCNLDLLGFEKLEEFVVNGGAIGSGLENVRRCVNLKVFDVRNVEIVDLNVLGGCVRKLGKIRVVGCICVVSSDVLKECVNLRELSLHVPWIICFGYCGRLKKINVAGCVMDERCLSNLKGLKVVSLDRVVMRYGEDCNMYDRMYGHIEELIMLNSRLLEGMNSMEKMMGLKEITHC